MAKTGPERNKHWLRDSDGQQTMGASPFTDEQGPQGGPPPGKSASSPLLKEAEWVRPRHVYRTLYATQVIHAQLLNRVSSDIPQSDVRLLVTQHTMDRWQRTILIPQQSLIKGTSQGGTVQAGQRRLNVQLSKINLPDGTSLALSNAKLNDASGQAGLTGKVDNHYLELGLSAVLTAALNIGVRGAAGSPTGFQESLPQQYAGSVGQSLSQSGQRIVERQLNIPPTITIEEGEEVVITLDDNLWLGDAPKQLP